MAWKNSARLAIGLTLVGQLLAGAPAWADRSAAGPEPSIGYVDLQQVRQELMRTPAWTVMSRKLDDAKSRAENDVEALRKTRYLTIPERQELDLLRAKQKPTEVEKRRAGELEGKSDALDREYTTLAQTEKPSPEQGARIRELDAVRKEGIALIQREIDRAGAALEKLQREQLEELSARVQKIVTQIAQRRGLSLVVERQLVLFGGIDVTADVVKALK